MPPVQNQDFFHLLRVGINPHKHARRHKLQILNCIIIVARDEQHIAGTCPSHKKIPPSRKKREAGIRRGYTVPSNLVFLFVGT